MFMLFCVRWLITVCVVISMIGMLILFKTQRSYVIEGQRRRLVPVNAPHTDFIPWLIDDSSKSNDVAIEATNIKLALNSNNHNCSTDDRRCKWIRGYQIGQNKIKSRNSENIIRRLIQYADNSPSGIVKYSLDYDVKKGLRVDSNYSAKYATMTTLRLPPFMEVVDLTRDQLPGGRGFLCITTLTSPNFTACLHARERDVYISASLWDTGVLDNIRTVLMTRALAAYPKAELIDAGANIGYFSLLAAAVGRRVVAIEPDKDNLDKFRAAARADRQWDRITLLTHALSDKRGMVTISKNTNNQGNLYILEDSTSDATVKTITMNDVRMAVIAPIAILKIDIEGHECRAFKKSTRLFKEIYIPYIFMEWMFTLHTKTSMTCSQIEVRRLTKMLMSRGYVPYRPSVDGITRLDPAFSDSDWNGTVLSMIWQHENAIHLSHL